MTALLQTDPHITTMRVCGDYIDNIWPLVENLLSGAIEKSFGGWTLEEVYSGIRADQMQLWLFHSEAEILAAVTTRIITYQSGIRCFDMCLSGGKDSRLWIHKLAELEAWAESQGCHTVEMHVRPGYRRMIKDTGYRHLFETLGKVLVPKETH